MDIVLKNDNGVNLINPGPDKHCFVENATCPDGDKLIVAPLLFAPKHEKNNPVVCCVDFGCHSYYFQDLVAGRQK